MALEKFFDSFETYNDHFNNLFNLVEKSDDSSSVEVSYKGVCGLFKTSGNNGKDIVSLVLKKSARMQV